MKSELNNRQLVRLLSGKDRLSIIEKEQQFEQIWRRVQPARKSRIGFWTALAAASSAATLALVLFFFYPTDRLEPEFTARGTEQTIPSFTLDCVDRESPGICRPGSKLSFTLESTDKDSYFSAFARRSDNTIIWYYPDRAGNGLFVSSSPDRLLLRQGIRLGQEQPPGKYEVFGIFSDHPLTRDDIKAALGHDLRGNGSLKVVRRTLVIENSP